MTFSDAVKILGLDIAASKNDIRSAYRALAVKNHPDKFQDEVDKQIAEKNFKRIQEAYEFLNGLMPAVNIEDRMTRSGYDKDSDAVKAGLDEILKMRPMSEGSFSYSDVTTTQGKIMKYMIYSVPLYVLLMIVWLFWAQIKSRLANLF